MTMQVMHIQGMFFAYQRHMKYERTRFRYNASTNIQPTVSACSYYVVKSSINNGLRELHKDIKLIKIAVFWKNKLFGIKVDNANRFKKTSNIVFVV